MTIDPATRPRSTRTRPAKAPLSEEAIVDAALAILKAEGLDAVSMRRVASALDTGAGSLYVYVAGRDGLLAAMFDRIIATVELEPPDPARWRDQLHTLLGRLRAALIAHPGIAAVTMIDPPQTDTSMQFLENLLGVLVAGGIGIQDAAWMADMLSAQVTYAAIEADVRRTSPEAMTEQVSTHAAGLPTERFPLITENVAALTAGDADERFRFAVDVVIDGVSARAARVSSAAGRRGGRAARRE